MTTQTHWENVYQTKAVDDVSWYRPHLEVSLRLIADAAPSAGDAIIDVGGGEATLVDDLVARGCSDVTVLDISAAAIDVAKSRLGPSGAAVHWITGDITTVELEAARYDVWHDRAVFHFLTSADDRAEYVRQVARAVRPGGHVIVATFGPEGPQTCSGLDVVRYDAEHLHGEFGPKFRLLDSVTELHETPWGTPQQFMYCFCRVE
ncbi:MAG: class I SAM-dependent methyltransferase [Phenylobacterium sp.]|uniref:class I SAM-dependent methyltransferase n=1 Tax=Brevundimonas sp. TaxID=1871086 RepID=UPI002737BA28|nr:class I SAM-dependent methyltransferase [Brevundimonas sp.]MDP3803814.1 class I SAM-dependent methyltransferase [Brevundimonas sp.]MDZ4372047.1 class I SAM-dependent methyltransferase [Phenylobacterium sp.]